MKKFSKKTFIVLVGIISVSLIAGNVLFAGGLVSNEDAAFVAGSSDNRSGSSNREAEVAYGWIPDADAAFVSTPFNGALVASSRSGDDSSQGFINAKDSNFVRTGSTSTLVCYVDGIQVTGKQCVN